MKNSQNYFEDDNFMSVSRFKRFEKCEELGMAPFGEPSTAMLIGSYVDAYISGTLDEFKEEHPEIISSRGKTKGQLKSEFKQADMICESIDNDPIFSKFMSGEKQVVFTGEIGGVPTKGMLDSYSKGIAINDLKVVRSVTDQNGEFKDFITPWGYDLQMAVYQELVFQNTGDKLPCYICAVTKEDPINKVIVQIPQSTLDIALYRYTDSVKRYYDVMMGKEKPVGCGMCDVCISKRKSTPIISMEELV